MSDSGVLSGYQWSLLSPLMLQRGVLAACRSLLGPRDCAGGPTISPVVGSLLLLELDYQEQRQMEEQELIFKRIKEGRLRLHCIVNNKVFIYLYSRNECQAIELKQESKKGFEFKLKTHF